jgi:signal transduction histidine kinase
VTTDVDRVVVGHFSRGQMGMISKLSQLLRKSGREMFIAALTLVLVFTFHGSAAEDRFLLILYYFGISSAAYLLFKRGALVLTVIVASVAAGTTLGYLYFHAPRDLGSTGLHQVRDFIAFCALLALCFKLAVDAYHWQSQESRLRRQRELEENTIATRAAALTCTSHEVRSPLAAIVAITEILLDGSAGELTHEQKDLLGEVDRSGKHLMSLVNDILDYAKAQAGRMKLAMETVSVPDLISQCVAIANVLGENKGVQVTHQIDTGVGELMADPLRLKQIILNLLTNAVKFSSDDSVVRIHVRSKDGCILISVRDTGRGIGPDILATLFSPYHQAAIEDRGIGTGLGLAITKLLVELHGGTLGVDSSPGVGSLFTVRLPIESNAVSATADAWTEIALCNSKNSQESPVTAV